MENVDIRRATHISNAQWRGANLNRVLFSSGITRNIIAGLGGRIGDTRKISSGTNGSSR